MSDNLDFAPFRQFWVVEIDSRDLRPQLANQHPIRRIAPILGTANRNSFSFPLQPFYSAAAAIASEIFAARSFASCSLKVPAICAWPSGISDMILGAA